MALRKFSTTPTTTTTTKNFYGGSAVPEDLKFDTLIYPMDLNDENFYPDCVCFTIQKRTGVSIQAVTNAASASVKRFKDATKLKGIPPKLAKVMKTEMEKNKGNSEEAHKTAMSAVLAKWNDDYPGESVPKNLLENIGQSLKEFVLTMREGQTNALIAGKDGRNILGSIYLNMPNGIQFNEAANWGGDSLGFMGKMTQDMVSGNKGDFGSGVAGAVAGGAGSLVGATIGALPSLVSKLGLQGGMFGAAIGMMAAGTPIQKGAESALGVAQNPYMEMMFSGIGFRKFQFEFIMRPKSTDEVNEVAEILNKLRTFTKPTFTEQGLGKAFMDYPMEFKIEFLTSGESGRDFSPQNNGFMINPYIPRLKDCVCDSITSNFTPQSIWAAHNEGAPVAVNLSLSFQETELVMAEDVYHMEY